MGIFKYRLCDARLDLAIFEADGDEFPTFAFRVYGVSHVLDLGYSKFRSKVDEGKAAHLNWTMPYFRGEFARVAQFVQDG